MTTPTAMGRRRRLIRGHLHPLILLHLFLLLIQLPHRATPTTTIPPVPDLADEPLVTSLLHALASVPTFLPGQDLGAPPLADFASWRRRGVSIASPNR